jgi:hypothetical protein
MAEVIVVEGESGVGKSTSLRNVPAEQSLILTASDKPLPFKGWKAWEKRIKVLGDMNEIPAWLAKANEKGIKYVIIEDHTHFQNARILGEKFQRAGETANKYARWEQFGRDVYASIWQVAKELKNIEYIIIMAHVMKDADGMYSFKTFGKMVGNTVDPVSYSRVVLHAVVDADKKEMDKRYVFISNNDGIHEAKSPMGMLPERMPNDLWKVLELVKAYDQGE